MREYFLRVKRHIVKVRERGEVNPNYVYRQAHERVREAIARVAKSRGLNPREVKAIARLMESVHHDSERDHFSHGKAWLTAARLKRKGLEHTIDALHEIASELRHKTAERVVGAGVHPIKGMQTMAFFVNPPAAMANVAQSARNFLHHPMQHAGEVRKMTDERVRKALLRYIREKTRPRQMQLSFRRQDENV